MVPMCISEKGKAFVAFSGGHFVLVKDHESKGKNIVAHLWTDKTINGLLKRTTDIWETKVEGSNTHERFIQQCKTALKCFVNQYLDRRGLFIYDNAAYAKKKEFVVSGRKVKQKLIDWAKIHHIDATETVMDLKKKIQESDEYIKRHTTCNNSFHLMGTD